MKTHTKPIFSTAKNAKKAETGRIKTLNRYVSIRSQAARKSGKDEFHLVPLLFEDYLGTRWRLSQNLGSSCRAAGVATPLGLLVYCTFLPRVARSSQPWALMRNPFGIEFRDRTIELGTRSQCNICLRRSVVTASHNGTRWNASLPRFAALCSWRLIKNRNN